MKAQRDFFSRSALVLRGRAIAVLLLYLEFYVFYLHILHTYRNLLCVKLMWYEGKYEGSVKDVKVGVGDGPPKKRLYAYHKTQIFSRM